MPGEAEAAPAASGGAAGAARCAGLAAPVRRRRPFGLRRVSEGIKGIAGSRELERRRAERAQEAQPRVQRDLRGAGGASPRPPPRRGRSILPPASESRPSEPAPSWGCGPGSTGTLGARAAGGPHIFRQNTLNSKGMSVSR